MAVVMVGGTTVVDGDQLPIEQLAVLSPGQLHLALHHVGLSQHPPGLGVVAGPQLEDDLRPLMELAIYPEGGAGGQLRQILQLSSPGDDDQPGGGLWVDHACSNTNILSQSYEVPSHSPTEQETLTVFSLT